MRAKQLIVIFFFIISGGYAQEELVTEPKKQTRVIDSLQKVIKQEQSISGRKMAQMQKELRQKEDSLATLRIDLSRLAKYSTERSKMEAAIKHKSDSLLQTTLMLQNCNKELANTAIAFSKQLSDERLNAQKQTTASFFSTLRNMPFDELAQGYSLSLLQRDLEAAKNFPDIKSILQEINSVLLAKQVLERKYDAVLVKENLDKLSKIKRESSLLRKLRSNLENYKVVQRRLEECITKLQILDANESAPPDQPQEVKSKKFAKVMAEISAVVFNVDLNAADYPYISDIVFELIKRKKPNLDADISDLMQKIQ
jgi:hypothetical protein